MKIKAPLLKKILLTGATGYIGGLLLKRLQEEKYPVRCFVKSPQYLEGKTTVHTQIIQGDLLIPSTLDNIFEGCDVAFYLVHSMGRGQDFITKDREAAINFAKAASKAKIKRIIYLGALGDSRKLLSDHLKSRQEVGQLLKNYAKGVEIVEFRASIVIGTGSISFEMIRALCERLPIMITPKWVWNLAQPIASEDVISYFMKAIDFPLPASSVFEIGGEDQMSYGDLMREYIRQRHLKRILIPVPFLSLHLSSLWLSLITPVYAKVGRQLIDGIRSPTIVTDHKAEELFQVKPKSVKEAITIALMEKQTNLSEVHDGQPIPSGALAPTWTEIQYGRRLIDSQQQIVNLSVEEVFAPIRSIGGKRGWYYGNWLWEVRGWLDSLFGGVGLRRGRVHEDLIVRGDPLDFWVVETYEDNHFLRLRAEMKLPGCAWLQFLVVPDEKGAKITQTAIFDPAGIGGVLYWYALYPIHWLIFKGMLNGIVAAAKMARNKDSV